MANRFRKVFIICEDNKIFQHDTTIKAFKHRENAENAAKHRRSTLEAEKNMAWNAGKPLPTVKVHAFFLVHEDMFRD
jgi:hypothetical protein